MSMHEKCQLPDLSFPNVDFGKKETPWDFNILLYKGGADTKTRLVQRLISNGDLNDPLFERVELVSRMHSEIKTCLMSGGSRDTVQANFYCVRYFFGFADRTSRPLSVETAIEVYCAWTDELFYRTQMKGSTPKRDHTTLRPISMNSAYTYAATMAKLLERVLDLNSSIIELTRLRHNTHRKTAVGIQAEKQNLKDTFEFGHMLQDICDSLTVSTVLDGPVPIEIELRNGKKIIRKFLRTSKMTFENFTLEQEVKLVKRAPLANLRIEAELLMFIGQTGMNLAQAQNLELRHFFYRSHLDGYQVKEYKNRRNGIVLFEIYKDYKPHFERYLEWRRKLFPQSDYLFPFIRPDGIRQEIKFVAYRIQSVCEKAGITFITPRLLRNTRVNWLLRMTSDPDLTAEMAQHTKEMLLDRYQRPSLQRTSAEVTRFWKKLEPQLAGIEAVSPGFCIGGPKELAETPRFAPKPNCISASGCLWCENHRDIDSFEYVWALTSFKHLKAIELSKINVPPSAKDIPPAQHAIDRILAKLVWFAQSNDDRHEWVNESDARIAEGNFHPNFRVEIVELEGTP